MNLYFTAGPSEDRYCVGDFILFSLRHYNFPSAACFAFIRPVIAFRLGLR